MGCKTYGGVYFILRGFRFHLCLVDLKLTPSSVFFFFLFLFSCRMARGYEEVSNSQVGRRRVTPRETPTASSLVVAMSIE